MNEVIACFDVFDTVLTRRVGCPAAVFYLVGQDAQKRGLISMSADEFARARKLAESKSRERTKTGEVTLREIYGELARQLACEPATMDALQAIELATETNLICALPGAGERLEEARQKSPRVIFASDMYLPADFLQARLREHGCWRDGDKLYLSADHGLSKANGTLFRHILESESLSPQRLHHTGNHRESDYDAPRRLGIAATLCTAGNLNRFEQELESFAVSTHGLASFYAGASRLARLATPIGSAAHDAIRDVGAGVAGPVLVSYVRWVLRQARDRQINRLYFVARDGHILLQLARQLAPRLHPDVELRYLYGSRQAWHLPGVFSVGAAELSWIFCSTDFLSVSLVCSRIGLAPAEISTSLAEAGFGRESWDENLPPAARTRLAALVATHAVAERVASRATAARKLLLEYLEQEKLLVREPGCALVDLGWHGRAHDSLAKTIRAAGFRPPDGFYFGLNTASGLSDLGARHAWLFNRPDRSRVERTFKGIEPLMEVFCTADHGPTMGYDRAHHRIEPVQQPARVVLQKWGWPVLQAAVMNFGRYIVDAPPIEAPEDAVRDMSLTVLKQFWQQPTPAEAAAWSTFPYEDDQSGTVVLPLAAPLRWRDVAAMLVQGRGGPHRATWWHGSLELTPHGRREALHCAHGIRRLAHAAKQAWS